MPINHMIYYQDVDEGRTQVSEEDLRQRKTKAVLGWLVRGALRVLCMVFDQAQTTCDRCSHHACWLRPCAMQEHQVGRERVELVRILQGHHVIVRGGPDEGQRLLDALLVRCALQPGTPCSGTGTCYWAYTAI